MRRQRIFDASPDSQSAGSGRLEALHKHKGERGVRGFGVSRGPCNKDVSEWRERVTDQKRTDARWGVYGGMRRLLFNYQRKS